MDYKELIISILLISFSSNACKQPAYSFQDKNTDVPKEKPAWVRQDALKIEPDSNLTPREFYQMNNQTYLKEGNKYLFKEEEQPDMPVWRYSAPLQKPQ